MKILVYGTLRREGIYHFDYLRKYKAKFIKEVKIKGYDLFNLTSYPAIVRGEGEVLVEMFEVSDECFEKIDKMEKNVGYESEETEGGTIWLFSEEELNRYKRKKIEHGDYIKFKNTISH